MVRGKDTAAKGVTKTVTKPIATKDRQWHVIDADEGGSDVQPDARPLPGKERHAEGVVRQGACHDRVGRSSQKAQQSSAGLRG